MSPDQDVGDAFARAWAVNAACITVDEDEDELLMPFTRYLRDMGRGVTGPELHAALATFRESGRCSRTYFSRRTT